VLDSLPDLISIAIDKRDETTWAGSFAGGLLLVKPGPVFEIYKQNDLGADMLSPANYRVAGLAFDADHNLWISNFGAAQPLRVRKTDGSWKNFTPPFPVFQNAVSQIVVDDNNYKWIVSPLGNGLLCFDQGASIDNTGDDRWRRYTSGSGTGNLPSADVTCIAKDKNGFIWVRTGDGIGVLQCPEPACGSPVCASNRPNGPR